MFLQVFCPNNAGQQPTPPRQNTSLQPKPGEKHNISVELSLFDLPGMRYCMFMASSRSLSFLMHTAAKEKRMEEQRAMATPTQLTM